jgi:hypothetical protein
MGENSLRTLAAGLGWVPLDESDPYRIPLPCLAIHLGRTKKTAVDDDGKAPRSRPAGRNPEEMA